ncbi:MAG: hypothetical protein WC802_02130 [Patescibacteria group bacterium]|jgi:hypothetical protein
MNSYVISADLSLLLDISPDLLADFRRTLTQVLEESVGNCEWVAETEMVDGLAHLLKACPMLIVSLDPVYAPRPLALNITRLVDKNGADAGYGLRDGRQLDLAEEIREIARLVGEPEIALVDDVVFSGAMMAQIISAFAKHGVAVRRVYAGVAIGEGANRLKLDNIDVHAVRSFAEVLDEVCERDFFPGAPMSGRTLANLPNTGAPYLLPFGNAQKWASIPTEHARRFSTAVLRASAEVYDVLGLRVTELPRRIHGLSADHDEQVSTVLRRIAAAF